MELGSNNATTEPRLRGLTVQQGRLKVGNHLLIQVAKKTLWWESQAETTQLLSLESSL